MSLRIPRLRQWLAASAVALICLVAAFYFYSRHRVQNALKQVPEKIGIEIQQSAKGFTISKSFQGHTLFKIEASKAVQFKAGGRGELHDVEITVYGHDSGRFDRISGKDFEYDAQTGDVIGKGEIQIDLEANPAGFAAPDQSSVGGLKNPVHLKTTDLVFNQKTGDAHADGEVDFSVSQANGSGVGLSYVARSNVLTLNSQVRVTLTGLPPISMTADRLTLRRLPRTLTLEHPRVTERSEHSQADKATVYLSQDNKLEHVLAEGDVLIGSERPDGGTITAGQLDLLAGPHRTLRQAILAKDVRFESSAEGSARGNAGRAVLNLRKNNILENVHADGGVTLTENKRPSGKSAKSQDFSLTAPEMDFSVAEGRLIRSAETFGAPRISVSSLNGETAGETTVITAAKFEATFDNKGQLRAVRGGPDARIVSKVPGKTDRVTTSQTINAEFQPGEGITAIAQKGSFAYNDGELQAWADSARYTPQDQMLFLTGSPRVADGGVTTTAQTIRLNRLSGTAYAEGNVKTTDTSIPPKARGGQTPPPTSPIHITAGSMTAAQSSSSAIYSGDVRLWQDANSVEAPNLELHRKARTLIAQRTAAKRVLTTLSQSNKQGKVSRIVVASDRLTYSQDQRIVHFDGDVVALNEGIKLTAEKMDCFLRDQTQALKKTKLAMGAGLEKFTATGSVVVTEPGRRVTGSHLVYTAAEDKFVMTGGSPSIFDAEHGVITGVSLTLFGRDGRVLVEGNEQSPAVTETRVAR